MAGELTDAEVAAFEEALSLEDKKQSQLLRQAFAGLPTLNEAIPEPQISFERIQDAILKAEPAPVRSGAGWNWRRLFMLGTPVVAAGILVGLVVRQQPSAPAEVDLGPRRIEASSALALGPTPAGVLEGEPESVRGGTETVEDVEKSRPVVVQVIPSKPAPKESVPEPRVRKATPRRLVAKLDRNFSGPSTRLVKRAAPVATPSTMAGVAASGPAVASTFEAAPAVSLYPGESVVVVTSTPSGASGANTAIEVSRQDDVILGG